MVLSMGPGAPFLPVHPCILGGVRESYDCLPKDQESGFQSQTKKSAVQPGSLRAGVLNDHVSGKELSPPRWKTLNLELCQPVTEG